jgi:release factor glutamine methyltransferase
MSIATHLARGVQRLKAAGLPNAPQDARRLMAHVLGLEPGRLTLVLPEEMSEVALRGFEEAIAARLSGQPISQITGSRLFWGRSFRVGPEVLDPRPETEILVSAALEEPFGRVLDLGTGSGCILLSLVAERGQAEGLGVDLSPAALELAAGNARDLGLTGRARFALSDWFAAVEGRFDLIVSNPPYIPTSEYEALDPGVRDWEPAMALTPGADGIACYRAIARAAPGHLLPGGRLLVEIGPAQGADVAALFEAAGLKAVEVRQDFDRRDRLVAARKPRNTA